MYESTKGPILFSVDTVICNIPRLNSYVNFNRKYLPVGNLSTFYYNYIIMNIDTYMVFKNNNVSVR